MEHEMTEMLSALQANVEELAVSVNRRLESLEAGGAVGKITAAVDAEHERTQREDELQRRLNEALSALEALRASAAATDLKASARKTLPAATVQLLAKQGIDVADAVDVATLDAALAGMSVEQRIAVKAQMLRTGALTL